MKEFIRHTGQWIVCIIAGFLICNLICFPYERQPGWFDTPSGASSAVWQPYSYIVQGAEGYGISKVDRNGFLNPDKELAD